MPNILIAFYSRDGSTRTLAESIASGAESKGATVRLRRVRELAGEDVMAAVPGWPEAAAAMNTHFPAPTPEDALWADAIVLGSPTRFGLVCSELKAYLDSLGGLWARGSLVGKVGSAFTSTSSMHGGNEVTNLTLHIPMMHFGMILVPPGYANPVMFSAGTPYGASSVSSGPANNPPSAADLAAAKFQGTRVAEVTRQLKAGRTQSQNQ